MVCGRAARNDCATKCSEKPVGTRAEEFEEAEAAKNLELLADFVADVAIVGMEFG